MEEMSSHLTSAISPFNDQSEVAEEMETRPRGREKPRPSDKTWIAIILIY